MNNPNPLLSRAHVTTFNLNNFKMIEAMGLKIMLFLLKLPADQRRPLMVCRPQFQKHRSTWVKVEVLQQWK
jgi:hypothetical protein